MSTWPQSTLGEHMEVLSGFAFPSEQFNTEEGTPLVRIRDVIRGVTETKFRGEFDLNYLVRNGDTLIGMDGQFNVGTWSGGPALLNQRVCRIKTKPTLDSRFLFHFLPKALKQIEDATSFVTVKHLSVNDIRAIRFPLPPLPEQRRIAAILDQAEALRAKRRQTLAKLDTLTQSLFLEMFGDPRLNRKNWATKKLGGVGLLERGISKCRPRNAPHLLNGRHPLIQTGDVANSDGWINSFVSTYSDAGLAQSRLWPAGTLCITIAANIAKTARLGMSACFPDSVVGFVPNDFMTSDFVQVWFTFWQKALEDGAPESAQKNINLAILRELKIIVPPYRTQVEFSGAIAKLHQEKAQMSKATRHIEALFASLQHKAFRGEL